MVYALASATTHSRYLSIQGETQILQSHYLNCINGDPNSISPGGGFPEDWGEHIFTEELAGEQEGLIQWAMIHEDWDVSLQEWVAIDFIGCPAESMKRTKR